MSSAAVEAAARAAALTDEYDGCFERLDGTDPEEPYSWDEEDADWWRRRASAALLAALPALGEGLDDVVRDAMHAVWTDEAEFEHAPEGITRAVIEHLRSQIEEGEK